MAGHQFLCQYQTNSAKRCQPYSTARVFRRDSPEKAAQWLARSIRESWGVLWLVIRLLSVRSDVSSSVIRHWERLYCNSLHTCQHVGALPTTTRTSPTPRRRTVKSKYSSYTEAWKQTHLPCKLFSKAVNLIEMNRCIQDASLTLIFEPIYWNKGGIYKLKLHVASATSEGRVRDDKVTFNDVMIWILVRLIGQFWNKSRNHQSSFTWYFRSYSVQ
jgi:hypothetical protein